MFEVTCGTPQIGTLQIGTLQIGKLQIGTPQIGKLQIGKLQIGTPQIGTLQIGKLQIGTPQIGTLASLSIPASPVVPPDMPVVGAGFLFITISVLIIRYVLHKSIQYVFYFC